MEDFDSIYEKISFGRESTLGISAFLDKDDLETGLSTVSGEIVTYGSGLDC